MTLLLVKFLHLLYNDKCEKLFFSVGVPREMADIFELLKKISSEKKTEVGTSPVSVIIAGLGNPGQKYTFTRHNAGFLAIDYISQKLGFECKKLRFKSLTGEATVGGVRVLFMKPETYMNNSGEAIREAADFYKIPPENVIVICDDVNLPVGTVRIRAKGSDGGQKGLRSTILHLNTDKFPRVKLGVGEKPSPEWDLADWVLGNFSEEDKKKMFDAFCKVADALPELAGGDISTAQNKCNG